MDFRPTRGLRSLREAAPGLRRNTGRLLKGFQPDLRAGRRSCSLQPPQTHTLILELRSLGLGMSAARGAIAAGHPATAQVGAEVLRAGGSAVDACVAAAFASWIAEPALTGPGGGGFLVAFEAARRRPLAIDCFVAVPGESYGGAPVAPLEPYVVDFGTGQQIFLVGPGSCAVPGVTAGLGGRASTAGAPALE